MKTITTIIYFCHEKSNTRAKKNHEHLNIIRNCSQWNQKKMKQFWCTAKTTTTTSTTDKNHTTKHSTTNQIIPFLKVVEKMLNYTLKQMQSHKNTLNSLNQLNVLYKMLNYSEVLFSMRLLNLGPAENREFH